MAILLVPTQYTLHDAINISNTGDIIELVSDVSITIELFINTAKQITIRGDVTTRASLRKINLSSLGDIIITIPSGVANITFQNIEFQQSATRNIIKVTNEASIGTRYTFTNCKFIGNTSTTNTNPLIQFSNSQDSNGVIFDKCEFYSIGTGVTACAVSLNSSGSGSNAITIRNSLFYNIGNTQNDGAVRVSNPNGTNIDLVIQNSTFSKCNPALTCYSKFSMVNTVMVGNTQTFYPTWNTPIFDWNNVTYSAFDQLTNTPAGTNLFGLNTTIYENYSISNFKPAVGSPIINSGTTVSGITQDLDSNTRAVPYDIGSYEYQTQSCNTPIIDTISPQYLLNNSGSYTVTVSGENYETDSIVRLNGSNQSTTYVSSTELSISVNSNTLAAGTYNLDVLTPDCSSSNIVYLYVQDVPTITDINPNCTNRSQVVTLTGTNIQNTTGVLTGITSASYTILSDTQLSFTIPSSQIYGNNLVSIQSQVGNSNFYQIKVAPQTATITQILPSSQEFGETIQINGLNLISGQVNRVVFKNTITNNTISVESSELTFNGGTTITLTVPTLPIGNFYSVYVETEACISKSNELSFEVLPPLGSDPVIYSISPTSTVIGSTISNFTLTGENFGDQGVNSRVRFFKFTGYSYTTQVYELSISSWINNPSGDDSIVGSILIESVLGASDGLTVGVYGVSVTRHIDGVESNIFTTFTINADGPTISSVEPTITCGGEINIIGNNFTNTPTALSVTFIDRNSAVYNAVDIDVISTTELTCALPSSMPVEYYNVFVTTSGGASLPYSSIRKTKIEPTIVSVQSTPIKINTTFSVTGLDFIEPVIVETQITGNSFNTSTDVITVITNDVLQDNMLVSFTGSGLDSLTGVNANVVYEIDNLSSVGITKQFNLKKSSDGSSVDISGTNTALPVTMNYVSNFHITKSDLGDTYDITNISKVGTEIIIELSDISIPFSDDIRVTIDNTDNFNFENLTATSIVGNTITIETGNSDVISTETSGNVIFLITPLTVSNTDATLSVYDTIEYGTQVRISTKNICGYSNTSEAYTILAPVPIIDSISPDSLIYQYTSTFNIVGQYFDNLVSVKLENTTNLGVWINVSAIAVNDTLITVSPTWLDIPIGTYNIKVITASGESNSEVITVNSGVPIIDSISPDSFTKDETGIVIAGLNFDVGGIDAELFISNGGTYNKVVNFEIQNDSLAIFTPDTWLDVGTYSVKLVNQFGESEEETITVIEVTITDATVVPTSANALDTVTIQPTPSDIFDSNTTVSLDGEPCQILSVDRDLITFRVPQLPVSSYIGGLIVTVDGGSFVSKDFEIIDTKKPTIAVVPNKFTYNNPYYVDIIISDEQGITAANTTVSSYPSTQPIIGPTQLSSTEVSYKFIVDTDGDLVIDATDDSGNLADTFSRSYIFDDTPPVVERLDSKSLQSTSIFYLDFKVTDDLSISRNGISISRDSGNIIGLLEDIIKIDENTINFSVLVIRSGTLKIVAIDNAGNSTEFDISISITSTGIGEDNMSNQITNSLLLRELKNWKAIDGSAYVTKENDGKNYLNII